MYSSDSVSAITLSILKSKFCHSLRGLVCDELDALYNSIHHLLEIQNSLFVEYIYTENTFPYLPTQNILQLCGKYLLSDLPYVTHKILYTTYKMYPMLYRHGLHTT